MFALGAVGGDLRLGARRTEPLVAGANGGALALLCAWAVPDLLARRAGHDYGGDLLGAGVIAAVLLAMPLVRPEASAVAGGVGVLAGYLGGLALARPRADAQLERRAARRMMGRMAPPRRTYTAAEVDVAVSRLRSPSGCATPPRSSPTRRPASRACSTARSRTAAGSTPRTRSCWPARACEPEPAERLAAVRALVDEQTRLGMLVGVAVGFELARELDNHTHEQES